MGLHPTIQECENPYSRWWWNGWLVGVLCGVAGTIAGYALAWWAGQLSVRVGL
jgi:hypothetical protein